MEKVWSRRPFAIYEQNGEYLVAKRKLFRGYRWNGLRWSEISHALSSIRVPNTESQSDYKYKLPKNK